MPLLYYRKPPDDTSKVATVHPQGEGVRQDDLASVHEGLIEQHIPESFSPIAALGLAFSITGSWVGYLSCFGQNISYAGPQNVVLGLVVATFVQWSITLGLSEIASAFPTSGGQYHATYLLATDRYRRPLSYLCGWFAMLGWWIITCSGLVLASTSILGLAAFCFPDLVVISWRTYLVYLAVMIVTASPLFIKSRMVPWVTQGCLYVSVLGFTVSFVLVLGKHQHFQPGSYSLDASAGSSGWPHAFAWILGAVNAMYAYVGTDAATHIAEEMRDPGRRIPQIMNLTMLIGVISALPLFIAMMYTITDPERVASAQLPALEAFYQATGSKAVACVIQVWVTTVYVASITSQWVTSGRMAWAFARDNGLPWSNVLSRLDERTQSPLNATCLSLAFATIYGLLYLASTNAFNSIITSAILYLNISYTIPQAILLIRGRSTLPPRTLKLGIVIGTFCNAFSVVAVSALVVLYSFPTTLPTTVAPMNYSSVVLVGLFLLIVAIWKGIGHRFEGPKEELQRLRFLH
ncbi:amino acid transporter [Aspergillus stella-maris]|uniref:amino acid transporter n=1 Tax=Aspergillus stella-maris TaxID=1810926 RepID=UPI003CCD9AA4